jgi:putative heme-binding domain-containing protein
VFFKSASAQCRNCHRIGKEGQEVGPDLTLIGKKYDRAQILESLLEPSKTIDPAFATFLVETSRGGVFSGLLVQKGKNEVILKDAQGKTVRIPAADIETMVPQQKSLMPELLLRDMTAREVVDMLEFLASLK